MTETDKDKILPLHDLVKTIEDLRHHGKVVVQSHGVFDLIHPGIINHLRLAKKQGDILVVTVIRDRDVRRGPGRPIFPDILRASNVASLEMVDYVCTVDDEIPFESVRVLNPDILAKGQAYKERDRRVHEKIFEEEKEFYLGKSRVHETGGFSFSSSQIINNFLDIYPEETRDFLRDFSRRFSFGDIVESLNRLRKLKILLIGDGIIDEYHYCSAMGKSAKSHLVVSKYLTHEVFYGGAFAIANHIAGICDTVHIATLLGTNDSREHGIAGNLKGNVTPRFFFRKDGPTIVKKRYVDQYLNQKIFEVNYLNDDYIRDECEQEVINYIEAAAGEFDLVLVSDFGHGFITGRIIDAIQAHSVRYAVNTQTNAANSGYNMITKYKNPFFVCLDEPEMRLAAQDRYGNIEDIARTIKREINAQNLIVTLGKKGSIGIGAGDSINRTPIFSSKVVDTIGAGDAFFAFTAPSFARELPLDMVSFIGNAVGALAVQIVGNKKSVEKYELLEFMNTILK
ncbi:MAG: PfkB family carbohydrate kinase [Nitrospiraceae bacterium]|nr:PfkB family carbohydrate kinase [Nitrospiraceae bacterium]